MTGLLYKIIRMSLDFGRRWLPVNNHQYEGDRKRGREFGDTPYMHSVGTFLDTIRGGRRLPTRNSADNLAERTIEKYSALDSLTDGRLLSVYRLHPYIRSGVPICQVLATGHHDCVRYVHSGLRQRLRGVQAYAAPTQRRDVPGGNRRCVPVRGPSHTTMLSSPALGLNRGGVRSAYACPHLRTGPSIGRGCLSGFPRGNVCSGIVCDRVRRRLHRTPRFPCHASTSVRVRDSAARIVVARQRRERSRTRLPTRSRRRESLHPRSSHAGRQDSVM